MNESSTDYSMCRWIAGERKDGLLVNFHQVSHSLPRGDLGGEKNGRGDECAGRGDECAGRGDECAGRGDECAGRGDECAGQGDECAGQSDECYPPSGEKKQKLWMGYTGRG